MYMYLYLLCRVIVDGPGSAVVFNGPTPLLDAMYTSTANYITGECALLEELFCST